MQDQTTCLNCDTVVEDSYCRHCGQRVWEHRGPLLGLFREFFGTVFDFDSRFLRSLRTLLVRPGRLTQSYLAGKRASTLPPVRMLILFIPVLALVLKILFLRSKCLYYDHVIFSLHFQSYLFLLIVVSWCLSWISPKAFLALLFLPIYLGLAMRRVYGQSWLWTLLKLVPLLASYLVVLVSVLLATFVYTVSRI